MDTRTIVDCHVHVDSVDAIEGFVQIMDDTGVGSVAAACIQYGQQHTNAVGLLMKALHPTRVFTLGGLDYAPPGLEETGLDFAGQAKRLRALGVDGMKMLEGKPNVRRDTGLAMDCAEYDGYYTYLQQEGMPVLWHVADPEEFWDEERAPEFAKKNDWLYIDPSFPPKEQLYQESTRVVEKYPELSVVFAHFYFLSADIKRAAAFLDSHPNVCFDLTPGSEMYYNFSNNAAEWREFFVAYQDRILFGTDNTAHTAEMIPWSVKNIERVRAFLETDEAFSGAGLALESDVLEKIYHGNFERVFGTAAKTVDVAGLVAYTAILVEHLRARGDDDTALAQLEQVIERLPSLV